MGCRLTKDEPSNDVQQRSTIETNQHKDQNMEKIDYKFQLERKMCLAKETPESDFDLSDCNLKEIPPGVFIYCRILLKEQLNLSNNKLTTFNNNINNGGQLSDLSLLKILDLRFNKIKELPDEIFKLVNLRELLISNNNLVKLPHTINCLKYLELLDVSSNKLQTINEINFMPNLRILNLAGNQNLKKLSANLTTCDQLCDLIIDLENIEWPPREICVGGAGIIIKYLLTGEKHDIVDGIDTNIDQYELAQDAFVEMNKEDALFKELQARDNRVKYIDKRSNNYLHLIENEYGNENALIEEFQLKQQKQKQELLQAVLLQQNETETLVNKMQQQKDVERYKLIKDIMDSEENANLVIDKFLALKSNCDSALLEKEHIEEQRLLEMLHLEHADLRKQEILSTMMETLHNEENKIQMYQEKRNASSLDILERENETFREMNKFYRDYERNRNEIIAKICDNEELQKQAVITLIAKNDARTWSLVEQLKIIEMQLGSMTKLEIEKKKYSNAEQMNELANKRMRLSCILMDLLDQQEKRKKQIHDTLLEIEAQKSIEQQDFWLMQYQKLLDSRPLEFSVKTNSIDPLLGYNFLVNGVIHCLPFLQKLWQNSNIYLEKLQDNDLQIAGILDDKDRHLILKSIEEFIKESNTDARVSPCAPVKVNLSIDDSGAACSTHDQHALEVSTSTLSISTIRGNADILVSECVICMEEVVKVIFLPCGHMCCCLTCQLKVELCPMCRAEIERKIKVVQP